MNVNDCDCVILCGGLGTRLKGVTGDVPKVMAEVDGRPFLDGIIEHVREEGIERVILCTGYKADRIENYYREHDFGITIDFSRENKPLGTGGALKNAREILFSNRFFVLNGDSFIPANFRDFLDFHKKKDALASIIVSKADQAKDFGSLAIEPSGRITGFFEKVEGDDRSLVSAGIYCFDQKVFDFMPEKENFSLETDLFPVLAANSFYAYRSEQKFVDIGTPERYAFTRRNIKKGKNIGHRDKSK